MPEKLTPSDIATVLRRLRKGDKALLDKKKALADLGYGSEKNVEEELKKANNYRGSRGLPPLDLSSKNYKSDPLGSLLVSKQDTSSIEVEKGDKDAFKYSPKGSVIEVSTILNNNHIKINVADEGTGISEIDQEYIFDRFYRTASARASENKGSGLGLAIVKNLINSLNGEVGVSNRPEGGSIFWFTLPIYKI